MAHPSSYHGTSSWFIGKYMLIVRSSYLELSSRWGEAWVVSKKKRPNKWVNSINFLIKFWWSNIYIFGNSCNVVSNTIYCIISMDRSLNYKFYFIYVLFINFINQMHCFLWIVSYILHFMHCIICAVIILLFALCASFINFHSIHFITSTILFSLVQKKA